MYEEQTVATASDIATLSLLSFRDERLSEMWQGIRIEERGRAIAINLVESLVAFYDGDYILLHLSPLTLEHISPLRDLSPFARLCSVSYKWGYSSQNHSLSRRLSHIVNHSKAASRP